MSFTVGIGIATYSRKESPGDTMDMVRAFTRQPNAALVAADDGSSDGTQAMSRDSVMIKGGLTNQSHYDNAEVERNFQLAQGMMARRGCRAPCGADNEARRFRSEAESAMRDGPGRFRPTPAESLSSSGRPAGRGFFDRSLHRF